LAAKRRQDHRWTEKTARQAAATFKLLEKFLVEECPTGLSGTTMRHFEAFDCLLRSMFKSYGKSEEHDAWSIAKIGEVSAGKPKNQQGLAVGTRNRHWNFIDQLLRFARKVSIPIDQSIDVRDFRARRTTRPRNDRAVPTVQAVRQLFSAPAFVGCAAWDDINTSGDCIFHRAAYFVPMLATYAGLRREAACGLAIADVVTVPGSPPYLDIRPNAFRRLKNPQSEREIPLHPELIRLGFLNYVAKLAEIGHERAFPDLYSPSTSALLGDRLYDELNDVFSEVGFTTHNARHFFDNELKQKKVSEEFRADLMGHGGKTETTERYVDPLRLKKMLTCIKKLPVVTSHLKPRPITLLPWVADKKWRRGHERSRTLPEATKLLRRRGDRKRDSLPGWREGLFSNFPQHPDSSSVFGSAATTRIH
jgi:hypothetical protein